MTQNKKSEELRQALMNSATEERLKQYVESVTRKLNNYYPESDIIDELTKEGFNKEQEQEFVTKIKHELPAMNKARKRASLKASLIQISIGCVLVTIGVV